MIRVIAPHINTGMRYIRSRAVVFERVSVMNIQKIAGVIQSAATKGKSGPYTKSIQGNTHVSAGKNAPTYTVRG